MAKVAVVNVPFFSHVGALMRFARVVVQLGHEVIVWGPRDCREQVDGWGATFELHEPRMPEDQGPGFVAQLTETTERLAEELIERLFPYQPDLLIHDSQTPWARVAGDYLGIARIVSHPMFPIVIDYARPSRASPLSNINPDEATARFEASWRSIARRWGVEIESTHNVIHSSAETTIAFTTETLLGDHPLEPNWHCVGPLMLPGPLAAPPEGRPLVYACFGTAYNTRPELFEAVVTGLADEPFDVLVSMGNGPFVSAADLEPLPPNVSLHDFLPSREVLARASVHITHGGCNSVHESLLAGVPMVCLPQAFDQFPLSGRLEALGVGLVADEEPIDIRKAVRLLLQSNKARTRASELSDHLARYDGEGRVAGVIDRVLAENAAVSA
jgi:MGT family glycosyltransferase